VVPKASGTETANTHTQLHPKLRRWHSNVDSNVRDLTSLNLAYSWTLSIYTPGSSESVQTAKEKRNTVIIKPNLKFKITVRVFSVIIRKLLIRKI